MATLLRLVHRIRKGHKLARAIMLLITLVMLVPALPSDVMAQTASTVGTTLVSQALFPQLSMADAFDEVMVVLDFAPGAGVPAHVHGGPTLVTVLDGAITLKENGTEKTYKAGESWTETPDHVHEVINNGNTTARVGVTFLLPKGAEPTTVKDSSKSSMPGPAVVYQAQFPHLSMKGAFDEMMVVLDFAPGAGVPAHVHGGPTLVTVLDGAITLKENGTEKTYKAGESWTEMPGHVHEAVNKGNKAVRVVVTFLLPVAEPTTLVK